MNCIIYRSVYTVTYSSHWVQLQSQYKYCSIVTKQGQLQFCSNDSCDMNGLNFVIVHQNFSIPGEVIGYTSLFTSGTAHQGSGGSNL